jgi:TRAP-type mannitol/chloroaromatic compound transport system permease small subunit
MSDPSDTAAPQNLFDRISNSTGKITSWLTLAMVIVTSIIVVMRYVFDAGLIWLQESVTWMHAAVFMIGAAYTLLHEDHVRVDIFYRKMSDRGRAIVDLFGVVVFLLPLCGLLALMAYDFAATAWSIHETSREPGGLLYPAIPLLKSIVVIMPIGVALQGVSLMLRSIATIRRR